MARVAETLVGVALGALGIVLLGASTELLAEPAKSAPAEPLRASADAVASYTLEAKLDEKSHSLEGKGSLVWTNTSSEPTSELWFHLYLNAFKSSQSLFLRSPFGAGRSGGHGSEPGSIDVTRLSVRELGGDDLWPRAAAHSPGDPEDQTDIRLPLPREIAGKATVTIDFEWKSRLPSIVERTGFVGEFHLAGHWFPKLARREPDGRWAHFAFHPLAEFYADFGRYEVTLDVPSEMVIGATGRETMNSVEGARRRVRYEADSVHDFAWTAWPRFRERRHRIEDVDVRFLYPAGHEASTERSVEAVRFALPRMNRLYGRYPHPTLTVVHPPEMARDAGGMEYPTLITTGGPWWMGAVGVRGAEGVTVHELGHQWFQGILASNEHEWPFLDEGLNTFAEIRALEAQHGAGSLVSLGGFTLSATAARRADAIGSGHDSPIAQPAARFSSFRSVGSLVYARTALVLETLGNAFGHAALERALQSYAARERFGHPEPKSFLEEVKRHMGADAHEALRTALFDKGWVDFELDALDCVDGEKAVALPDAPRTGSCRALVRRKGTLRFPVSVELVFADGRRERRRWEAHEEWATFDSSEKEPMVAAIVDPEREILLDETFANNAKRTRVATGRRTLERIAYVVQLGLGVAGP